MSTMNAEVDCSYDKNGHEKNTGINRINTIQQNKSCHRPCKVGIWNVRRHAAWWCMMNYLPPHQRRAHRESQPWLVLRESLVPTLRLMRQTCRPPLFPTSPTSRLSRPAFPRLSPPVALWNREYVHAASRTKRCEQRSRCPETTKTPKIQHEKTKGQQKNKSIKRNKKRANKYATKKPKEKN